MRIWKMISMLSLVGAVLALGGCGETDASNTNAVMQQAEAAGLTVPEAMKAFDAGQPVTELTIEGNDQMRYNKDRLAVKAGAMVRLTLKHVGTLPIQSMGHNLVIINPGIDPFEFSADVNENGGSLDNSYVPEPLRDRVIAYTEMIGGGETAVVGFKAPQEPGKYPFLCSFPGHVGMMQGLLIVE